MALTRSQKSTQLQELKDSLKKSSSVVFTQYIGLTVGQVTNLRKKLREAGAEMKVAKKSLMQIASKENGLPEVSDDMLKGAVACIFSFKDPVAGPQAAFAFAKEHPQVSFLGGFFEGKILSSRDATTLATIPPRPILLATFAGMIRSPLQQFASICSSPLSGFARSLSELAKKKAA